MFDRIDLTSGVSLVAAALLAVSATACSGTTPEATEATDQALCQRAAQHAQSCLPDQQIPPPDDCNPEAARKTLDASCNQLQASTAGKSDSTCTPWTWWTCGGDADPETGHSSYDVTVNTEGCQTGVCFTTYSGPGCAKLVLVNADDEIVSTTYTSKLGNGQFSDIELPNGTYRVKMMGPDGSVAEVMAHETGDIGANDRAPAIRTLRMQDGDILMHEDDIFSGDHAGETVDNYVKFQVKEENVVSLERCKRGAMALESYCDGEQMTPEATEFSWVAEIRGQTEAGEIVEYDLPTRIRDKALLTYDTLYAGDYRVTFHAVDVASWDQELNLEQDEMKEMIEWDATGRTAEASFEVSWEDPSVEQLDLGTYEVDYGACE